MKKLPKQLLQKIAIMFSSGKKGFPLVEISPWFSQYQSDIPIHNFGPIKPTKPEHFINVLESLSAKNQRYSLIDLCRNPPKYSGMPQEEERKDLLRDILSVNGHSPVSISLDGVTFRSVREQWWVAISRLAESPSGAITAARSLIETTCCAIIAENKEEPIDSGKILELLKKTTAILKLTSNNNVPQSIRKIVNGLYTMFNGLAELSNSAGDRHGNAEGLRITDTTLASIAVHSAGVVSLFLVQLHFDNSVNGIKSWEIEGK
ncbi:MAG: abortive infection family protein [Candidatus Omnitrophica bacterium]|nr:abortive infection family protein [Candidatus Omnitrophota bacterium]